MSIAQIAALVEQCRTYGFSLMDAVECRTLEEIARAYNGAGPERWPEALRSMLGAASILFSPAVLWHDCCFEDSDGTLETFRAVSEAWKTNTGRVLKAEYPLCSWHMLRPSYRAARAYWSAVKVAMDAAVSGDAAFRAWKEAHEAAQKKGVGK